MDKEKSCVRCIYIDITMNYIKTIVDLFSMYRVIIIFNVSAALQRFEIFIRQSI
jgi:hypothetical protein